MSTNPFKKLTPHAPAAGGHDDCYYLDDIRALPGVEVHTLREEKLYAAVHGAGTHWVSVAIFEWSGESDERGVEVTLLWDAEGTGEGLRELRHSNFGQRHHEGYVFYANLNNIRAACDFLARYFDEEG